MRPRQAAHSVLLGITLLASQTWSEESDFPIPLIQPGYSPALDAKSDEKGLWMEMQEATETLKISPLVLRDGILDEYVQDLVCHVADEYCGDIRVFVIRNPHFNASMAPNGTMLVHTGLLVRAASTDQIAAVLGHELAHYTQTHSLKRLRVAKNRMTVGAIFSIALGATVGGAGLPEIFALSSVMGYGRKQEREADMLGSYFMGRQGYNPEAAAEIWKMLEYEEERASFKHEQGPLFLSSHPRPDSRAQALLKVAARIGDLPPAADPDPFVDILQNSYELLMDEQVKQGDHGRLNVLIERHAKIGIAETDLAFYRGESWRMRSGAGDHMKAIEAYMAAINGDMPNARAYRELGYLHYKHGEIELAQKHFRSFLELVPDASDREMIEFYLGGGW